MESNSGRSSPAAPRLGQLAETARRIPLTLFSVSTTVHPIVHLLQGFHESRNRNPTKKRQGINSLLKYKYRTATQSPYGKRMLCIGNPLRHVLSGNPKLYFPAFNHCLQQVEAFRVF